VTPVLPHARQPRHDEARVAGARGLTCLGNSPAQPEAAARALRWGYRPSALKIRAISSAFSRTDNQNARGSSSSDPPAFR
jgi:hypothetical protein